MSDELLRKADALNDLASLITKLNNLKSAVRDYDRLRLDGARFLSHEDEEFQVYMADMDGIRTLACGLAGDAVREELADPAPIEHLCHLGEESSHSEMEENELRPISGALDRAIAKAESRMKRLIDS